MPKAIAQDAVRDAEGGITEFCVVEDSGLSSSISGPTCRQAGLSLCDDRASNAQLCQSRNHGGARLSDQDDYWAPVGAGHVVSLKAESFLKGISAIVRAICQAERGAQSQLTPLVPQRGRSYFAPEPASRTRPRRIHSHSAGCVEMLLDGNCRRQCPRRTRVMGWSRLLGDWHVLRVNLP